MRPKTMIAVVATVAAVGGTFAWLEYHRVPAPTATLESDVRLTATQLWAAFSEDEVAAGARFNGKVVEVTGTVKDVTTGEDGPVEVMLDTGDPVSGVVCVMEPGVTAVYPVGRTVRVKGVCTGMLLDVVLVRCTSVP